MTEGDRIKREGDIYSEESREHECKRDECASKRYKERWTDSKIENQFQEFSCVDAHVCFISIIIVIFFLDDGRYDAETFWEQIDNGKKYCNLLIKL